MTLRALPLLLALVVAFPPGLGAAEAPPAHGTFIVPLLPGEAVAFRFNAPESAWEAILGEPRLGWGLEFSVATHTLAASTGAHAFAAYEARPDGELRLLGSGASMGSALHSFRVVEDAPRALAGLVLVANDDAEGLDFRFSLGDGRTLRALDFPILARELGAEVAYACCSFGAPNPGNDHRVSHGVAIDSSRSAMGGIWRASTTHHPSGPFVHEATFVMQFPDSAGWWSATRETDGARATVGGAYAYGYLYPVGVAPDGSIGRPSARGGAQGNASASWSVALATPTDSFGSLALHDAVYPVDLAALGYHRVESLDAHTARFVETGAPLPNLI